MPVLKALDMDTTNLRESTGEGGISGILHAMEVLVTSGIVIALEKKS